MKLNKLHLGCGEIHIEGMVNVDRRYGPAVDRVDNIGILQHYPVGGVEEIYACHALDHFDRWTYKTVLKRWFDLLQPGGVLRISTPDFAWAVAHYTRTGCVSELIGHLYAGQDYPDNVRHWIWDSHQALLDLKSVGFVSVERYDPFLFLMGRTWDCSTLKDEQGVLRSLNVLARKAP